MLAYTSPLCVCVCVLACPATGPAQGQSAKEFRRMARGCRGGGEEGGGAEGRQRGGETSTCTLPRLLLLLLGFFLCLPSSSKIAKSNPAGCCRVHGCHLTVFQSLPKSKSHDPYTAWEAARLRYVGAYNEILLIQTPAKNLSSCVQGYECGQTLCARYMGDYR